MTFFKRRDVALEALEAVGFKTSQRFEPVGLLLKLRLFKDLGRLTPVGLEGVFGFRERGVNRLLPCGAFETIEMRLKRVGGRLRVAF